jgi:tight adherence protein B
VSPRGGLLLLFVSGVGLVVLSVLSPEDSRRRLDHRGLRQLLAEAGLPWSPFALAGASVGSALGGTALARALTGLPSVSMIAGVASLPLPLLGVLRRRESRRRQIVDAWPDAIDTLLAAVRSGDSLPSALETAAISGPEPLRLALGAVSRRARASGDFGGAIHTLAMQLQDPVSRQVGAALTLAHEVGGRDLGQVLRDLSLFLREERAARRELQARQTWTVNAARVAAAGPWAVLLLLSSHGATRDAFARPMGTVVLIGGAVLSLIGYRAMLIVGRLPGAGGPTP